MQILLTLGYDGTDYAGWQRQNNAVAVQQRVEEALSTLYKRRVAVLGASRTDAGVHAEGQRAAFINPPEIDIPTGKLPLALNALLPADIRVFSAEHIINPDFHVIFSARRKTYRYRVFNAPHMNPLTERFACHVPVALDVPAMRSAAACFVGTRDFKAFMAAGSTAKTTVRQIFSLNIDEQQSNLGRVVDITVTGGGFLYNMVRIIAGTLIYVGEGRLAAGGIPPIIDGGDRTLAGKTAPAKGLCLLSVEY